MVRRKRDYKIKIEKIRYELFKSNLVVDFVEAVLDFRHKPSYGNLKKLFNRYKRLKKYGVV